MNLSKKSAVNDANWTRRKETALLFMLAAVQFTTVLDFLIILPLGPQYGRVFKIDPAHFGYIVSAYGIAAGIGGLAAGFFLDRFDRKTALLFLFFGFTVGTFCCAISNTYILLVLSRFVAGLFGGVVGAVILAIVGDVVPQERRGAAMGMVMSSFSVASIIGVPLGLYLATKFYWNIPFYGLTGLSVVIFFIALAVTPSIRGHMEHPQDQHPVARVLEVMMHPDHQKAFIFMASLTCAGFCVFPYISTYMVANVGLTENQLPLIYICGGLCTIATMNLVGRWADRSGKPRVFTIVSLAATIPILALTNLPRVPLALAIATSTLLMIFMSGRMVPAMAMMTSSVEARFRGGFMSINSAVQQLSMGLASLGTGMILGENAQGEMTRYPTCGIISIFFVIACIFLAKYLKAPAKTELIAEPVMVEM